MSWVCKDGYWSNLYCVWECVCMQARVPALERGWGLAGFYVQVPVAGKVGTHGSYWAAWVLEPSFWRAPRGAGWVPHQCCLWFPECCGFCLFWSACSQGCTHVCMSWVPVFICACWEAGLGSTKLQHLPSSPAARLGSSSKYCLRTACSEQDLQIS